MDTVTVELKIGEALGLAFAASAKARDARSADLFDLAKGWDLILDKLNAAIQVESPEVHRVAV